MDVDLKLLNMHQNKLDEIFPQKYKIKKRFLGGMSNYTYLIEEIKTTYQYVYRYPGQGSEIFTNYFEEFKTLEKIKKLKITNDLIFYKQETGIKISKYVKGETLNNLADYQQYIPNIVTVLKKLHQSKIKLKTYNHLYRLDKYEKLNKNKDSQYKNLKKRWEKIYEKELKSNLYYPTHGDSQKSNIIYSENNVKLIDFEFSGLNDYIYDIASFGNQKFSDALALLYQYEPNPTQNQLKRLYGWRIYQCLQWYNVALYKEQIGLSKELDINFLEIAYNYLKTADNLLTLYDLNT